MTPSEFRAHAALEILKQMVTTGGNKPDKVWAAVEYADLLVFELNETSNRLSKAVAEIKKTRKK